MTLLVFGRTGQLARELQRQGEVLALGREEADLSDPAACAAQIARIGPQAVINAAAYTAVDRAEEEEAQAFIVNAEAPAAMARETARLGIPFLHVSTDYVFDGSGTRPWRPEDRPAPLGAYGRTKLAGERGVAEADGRHVILRTSWVFSAHGRNFVKTMLRLGGERGRLGVVADQVGGPTSAAAIARALLAMAGALAEGRGRGGLYHYCGAPAVSWAGFAREIFARAGMDVAVEEISTADYPTPARRPLNSRLDCSAILRDHGLRQPDWRADLDEVLRELGVQAGAGRGA